MEIILKLFIDQDGTNMRILAMIVHFFQYKLFDKEDTKE